MPRRHGGAAASADGPAGPPAQVVRNRRIDEVACRLLVDHRCRITARHQVVPQRRAHVIHLARLEAAERNAVNIAPETTCNPNSHQDLDTRMKAYVPCSVSTRVPPEVLTTAHLVTRT